MKKKMMWLILMLIVFTLSSLDAQATTMGPPAASLDAEQFRVGIDYSKSDMSIDIDGEHMQSGHVVGSDTDPELRTEIKDEFDFESEMIFANFGYGISDKLEVFLRLGMADATIDSADIDGSSEFAYGFGAKASFYEKDDFKLGALFQMTWASSDDTVSFRLTNPQDSRDYADYPVPIEIDYYQLKFAIGPTYELTEGFSIYGGPFYHLINGEIDGDAAFDEIETTKDETITNLLHDFSADIEESTSFGGYFGVLIDVDKNIPFCVEYQVTSDADILGVCLAYRF